jgi:hypothetical protein
MAETAEGLFAQDLGRQKKDIDTKRLLAWVQTEHGKSIVSVIREYWRLKRGPGGIDIQDYFLYQLYDDARLTPEDKARFLSDRIHWPIARKCCDLGWLVLTEDKWCSYRLLSSIGVAVPETAAVIDRGLRNFGDTPKLSTPEALRDWLVQNDRFPLFGKPCIGIGSFGCFIIKGVEGERLLLDQAEPMTCEAFFERTIGKHTYVLQYCLENHPTIGTFTPYLATVRTMNLVGPDTISTPSAVIKIPAPTSIADNYWRPGNIMGDIDVESGIIRRAVRGKGIEMQVLERHPDTDAPLVGLQLPHWQELREINDTCARHFAPVRFQSLDIALTPEGPVVVEINSGGAFLLPQLASGQGFLTDEVRAFFESCGWSFSAKKARPSSGALPIIPAARRRSP